MSNNILEIYCDSLTGTLKTFDIIPRQTLKLIAYKITFDTAANAKTCGMLKFSAEFLGNNTFSRATNDTTGTYDEDTNSGIPLLIDASSTAVVVCPNLDISMNYDIDGDISYNITSLGASTGFVSLHLVFSYTNGMI